MSGLSSVVMIGKSGAEAFLTFSADNVMETAKLKTKIWLLIKWSPIFITCAMFRIGSLALLCAWDLMGLNLSVGLLLIIPFIALLIARHNKWINLTVGDITMGIASEFTTIATWGGRVTEQSKKLNMVFSFWYLAVLTLMLIFVLIHPEPFFFGAHFYFNDYIVAKAIVLRLMAVACLILGWMISLPLTLWKICGKRICLSVLKGKIFSQVS